MRFQFIEPGWTRGRVLRVMLIVGLAYYIGARIGLALTMKTQPVSTLWPPNAILLAALLLTPRRIWPFVLLGALPAHLLVELSGGIPLSMVLSWFVSNSAQALLGAALMRVVDRSPQLDSFRRVANFLLAGVFLATFLSSFLDAAFVAWNRFGTETYWDVWRTRFLSNVLATLALVPVVVHAWGARGATFGTIPSRRYVEGALLTAGLLIVCVLAFVTSALPGTAVAMLYAPLPFLLWAAMRFGPGASSASLLVLSLFAVWAAINGHQPFDASSAHENAQLLQLFLIITYIPVLTLSALIAERRRREEALRRSEERFAVAFRSSPDALAIIRRSDGHVVDVNERWVSMFSCPRSAAVGRSLPELNLFRHEDDGVRFSAHLAAQGHLKEVELQFRTRHDESRTALVTGQAVTMADENCFLIVMRDVTDRHRAEVELSTQRAELAHLSRVALLGELSAAFAHELNQPLAAIMANARAGQRLIGREPPDITEVASILEDIVADDRRAGEVISRLQALLRRGELQLQPLDINELVREVVELIHSELIRREVLVHTRLTPALPRVPADRVQVQQVLMNLLVNACDAMGDQPRAERIVTIFTGVTLGKEVKLSVADQGPGLPLGKEEQVFEPFFTSKRHGLGLGLSICRTIVTAHGGALWGVNNPDRGATFHLVLRARHEAA
ncbi:MAG TPA: MASE1 domain-containing protein [Gemmatimonadales bacterium]|nr:MASE1 domain-containing protein [Gemmatimonadales bacterium]